MSSNYDSDEEPDRRRLWGLLGVAGVLGVALVAIWWPGCRQYPAVTSRESLSLMRLLYTACNTKDSQRLQQVEQRVEKATREGKMSPPEQQAFARIIAMAKKGEWTSAEKAAFKFAQDQVGVGHPDPQGQDQHQKNPPKVKR